MDVEGAPDRDDPADEGEGAVDTLDPDDGAAGDGTDPASSESNGSGGVLYEALPTTLCPIDIPAPFTPTAWIPKYPGTGMKSFASPTFHPRVIPFTSMKTSPSNSRALTPRKSKTFPPSTRMTLRIFQSKLGSCKTTKSSSTCDMSVRPVSN